MPAAERIFPTFFLSGGPAAWTRDVVHEALAAVYRGVDLIIWVIPRG